ncbi:uncharacterized protein MELLADRAFT_86717 [Melampsora larici-populina 98AG31]|uniref:Septin-type G domain-containing protein n=1 Tax=Melampsora larici-populina (strain 98AG31 / pathotype 3-4-7) TaxID=747676 RepID=F4R347_MELLP|nr:uncharacterized protein MELLADRAFT_86717 [Melampsora larici-populina 98AG31]EGG12565.1 hypothetical protein MELLADRAFT_86717 [Melampsora larici-populina 98AG31]
MPNLQSYSIQSQQHPSLKSPNRLIPRKSRQIPTFNLILVGSIETGKTSFLKTILATFGISLDSVTTTTTHGGIQHHSIGTVPGLNGDRIALTIIDTPSLDLLSNDELKVEHQVNEILRCLESKFEHTLNHEQQVKREPIRFTDSHVHCCLYFLNPTIIESAQRASQSDTPNLYQSSRISMSKMELRAMKRIGKRSNVLPVIGRSDELTIQQLTNIRTWLRTEMKQSGLDLSLFTGSSEETDDSEGSDEPEAITTSSSISSSDSQNPEATANPLKTRRKSLSVTASLSHHKRIQCTLTLSRSEEALFNLIPLSLINPESLHVLSNEELMGLNKLNPIDPHLHSIDPNRFSGPNLSRQFRWGTLNVLDPLHCELVLLRAVLFGTHFSKLKESTRLEKKKFF